MLRCRGLARTYHSLHGVEDRAEVVAALRVRARAYGRAGRGDALVEGVVGGGGAVRGGSALRISPSECATPDGLTARFSSIGFPQRPDEPPGSA